MAETRQGEDLFELLYHEPRRRARSRLAAGGRHVPLDITALVHEALDALGEVDRRLIRVVEMRYFARLSEGEIGAAPGVTGRTVRRDRERARPLLAEMLERS